MASCFSPTQTKTSSSATDKALEQLKCPICTEVPQAEIYQCKNGHIICSCCQSSIRQYCPQCRVPLKVYGELIRNRALEAILDSMTVSCPYHGCSNKMSRKELKAHTINCIFNGKCIQFCKIFGYNNCQYYCNSMNPGAAISHLVTAHKEDGSLAIGMELGLRNSVDLHLTHLPSRQGFPMANNISSPVAVKAFNGYYLVLTVFNSQDWSVSWICLKVHNEDYQDAMGCEVEFQIGLSLQCGERKMNPIRWKVTPTSILDAEEAIRCPMIRTPVPFLKQRYTDSRGKLNYRVTFVPHDN